MAVNKLAQHKHNVNSILDFVFLPLIQQN